MNQPDLDTLKHTITGEVILPADEAYEQARQTFAAVGAPALVVRPRTTADVVAAIAYGRAHELELSVRSGGHSAPGFSTNTGGLVIDLALMDSIEILDAKTGLVRLGGGAKWGEVARALAEHGLALTSGDTVSVGVGGLTLGGGIGWMVRKYGLAIDSLVAAEVVTADGRILRASADEQPDLFWALRGGGGNFGVVTAFEFGAHPVRRVVAGSIAYGLDNLPELLKGWRDCMRAAPEELTTSILVMPPMRGNPPMAMILCCYGDGDGDTAAAQRAIEPLTQLGTVLRQDIKEKAYVDVLEEARPPAGIRVVVKNLFAESFSDELIAAIVATAGRPGSPMLQIRSLGGAMKRVPVDATAMAHRNSEIMMFGAMFMPEGAPDGAEAQAMKTWHTLAAFGTGAYANFISTATAEDVAAIYPRPTYERLAKIKKIYDPHNIFSHNFNIRPAATD